MSISITMYRLAMPTSPAAGGGVKTGKRAFANDLTQPVSLQVTKARLNRQKGKQPPDEWRPDDRRGWCGYAADWVMVKSRWALTVH